MKALIRKFRSRFSPANAAERRQLTSYSRYLSSLETLSRDEIQHEQFKNLKLIVGIAYNQTVFYREHYRKHDFHPDQLLSMDDLHRIPEIDKAMIIDRTGDLVVQGTDLKSLSCKVTSGSTGVNLRLPVPKKLYPIDLAIVRHYWNMYGYQHRKGRVEFRGEMPLDQTTLFIPEKLVLRVNRSRLKAEYLAEILGALRKTGYDFYHGVPSAVAQFAKLLQDLGKQGDLPHPRGIFLSSEILDEFQREQIQAVFPDSPIQNFYGQSEKVATAGWIPGDARFHFHAPSCITEIVGDAQTIVGTNLYNDVVPMIRYATQDRVTGIAEVSDQSSVFAPVVDYIEGRLVDSLYTTSGSYVSPTALCFVFRNGTSFRACKFIQHSYQMVEIILESSGSPTAVKNEMDKLLPSLREMFGSEMEFRTTLVDAIPYDSARKFKWVESRIPRSS